MGWVPGSIPGYVMIALISVSVIFQMTGEAIASYRKEVGMTKICILKLTVWIYQFASAFFIVGAGVGGNLIAGWLPASA
ncbi:MAG: hypothetical protein ACYC06_02530 [Ilumatobacteraceae bacterium]